LRSERTRPRGAWAAAVVEAEKAEATRGAGARELRGRGGVGEQEGTEGMVGKGKQKLAQAEWAGGQGSA
jgi:hypothetical protein